MMPSARLQQQIERLLDQAEQAIDRGDWAVDRCISNSLARRRVVERRSSSYS